MGNLQKLHWLTPLSAVKRRLRVFTISRILKGALPKETKAVPCTFTDEVRMGIEQALRQDESLSPTALREGLYLSSTEIAVMAGGKLVRLQSDQILHVEGLVARPARNLPAESIVFGKSYRVEHPQILLVIGYNEVPLWRALI